MEKILINELPASLKSLVDANKHVFKTLEDIMYVETYEENESIFPFNEPVSKLHYLIDGKAKTNMIHEDGKRSIVSFLKPKEFIGELSLIGVDDEPKNIEAISECVCLTVPIDLARERLLKDEEFLLMLTQYIGRKLIRRTWYYMKSQNYPLKNRLAAYMLMTEHKGFYSEKHTETAEFLGISYRHLLHTLKQFDEEGLIEKNKKGYVLNMDALNDLARDFF